MALVSSLYFSLFGRLQVVVGKDNVEYAWSLMVLLFLLLSQQIEQRVNHTWFRFLDKYCIKTTKSSAGGDSKPRCLYLDTVENTWPKKKKKQEQYDDSDPRKAWKRITVGYRKWAQRYIAYCGQEYINKKFSRWAQEKLFFKGRDVYKSINGIVDKDD